MLHSTAQLVKNLPANAGDARDAGSIPVLGRSPGGQHGNPLQYSYLENPMDRGDWQSIGLQRVRGLSTQESAQKLAKSIDHWPLLQDSFFI